LEQHLRRHSLDRNNPRRKGRKPPGTFNSDHNTNQRSKSTGLEGTTNYQSGTGNNSSVGFQRQGDFDDSSDEPVGEKCSEQSDSGDGSSTDARFELLRISVNPEKSAATK
jgi:hypothetical protein